MTGIALMLLAALIVWGVFLFNRLVQDRNQVRSAWSDIDVQLTRRYDLIPRLVEAVKAYAAHEAATMQAVVELRSRAQVSERLIERAGLESKLEAGVNKLLLLAESYPDLKANQNFLELQQELVDVEDHLQYARRFYNGSVRVLNTRIETVPDTFVARLFGFEPAEFFESGVRNAPEVSLD